MKLKRAIILSAAFVALPLAAHAQSESSETNGVPGGTISTPGSESKGNPIPPATKSGDDSVIVITPEAADSRSCSASATTTACTAIIVECVYKPRLYAEGEALAFGSGLLRHATVRGLGYGR
jgi:hypothetical protein